MKYLVNRETKEHRVFAGKVQVSSLKDWRIVEADADGWIKWEGGDCPLMPSAVVSVKHRGEKYGNRNPWTADGFKWAHSGGINDIIIYRKIKMKPKELLERAVRV